MATQFSYQDRHGKIYAGMPSLALTAGLIPGNYDTQTQVFTPIGNPTAATGPVITEAGFGGTEKVISGLQEDRGAHTAPLNGVAFAGLKQQKDALQLQHDELQVKHTELEQDHAKIRGTNLELQAKIAALEAEIATKTAAPVAVPIAAALAVQEAAATTSTTAKKVVKTPVADTKDSTSNLY